MDLVVFTSSYTVNGNVFLEEEVLRAQRAFDKIIIVSLDKTPGAKPLTVPENGKLIRPRQNYSLVKRLFRSLTYVFKPRVIKEFFSGIRERGIKQAGKIFFYLISAEDVLMCLKKNEKLWLGDKENTVYYSYWLDAAAFYLCKYLRPQGFTCIAKAHGGDCFYDRGFHEYMVAELKGLNAVCPASAAGRNDILAHYLDKVPELQRKLRTFRLGIKIDRDFKIPAYKSKVTKHIVTCSNMVAVKRLDVLVEALKICGEKGLNIKWTHFGSGELEEDIKGRAEEMLGEFKNIHFEFMGRTDNSAIRDYYKTQNPDLFINCSKSEGIPVSIMEAMMYGIPVLAGNVGGIGEILDDKSGILLPGMAEAESLASAIEKIFALADSQHEALSRQAREKVLNDFDAEKNYDEFFEFVKETHRKNRD